MGDERGQRQVDFFISHAGPDRAWAEWLAWHLEDAGHTTELDHWDWAPGGELRPEDLSLQLADLGETQADHALARDTLERRRRVLEDDRHATMRSKQSVERTEAEQRGPNGT
ncbi:toll/interleukin-1 receptor domain-containing protein [Kitasatospora sp. NPDC057015]|uniref:toll/interleukin-1 receptor domain-containing protein n=1 Tax=Kitasatospora sp. NPDC057015 TaxID=3346001 RepID=UPI00363F0090